MPDHIEAYVHEDRIGVLAQFRCRSRFTFATDEFIEFTKNISIQIAIANPSSVSIRDLNPKIRNNEIALLEPALAALGHNGRFARVEQANSWINEEHCLLEQTCITDHNKMVAEYISEVSSRLAEKLVVVRFVRWEIGKG